MYVAVKGGERAIANAHALLAKQGRGDSGRPALEPAQIADQLGVLVSRVMSEGSLYDPELAGRAIVQAQGDVLEAITLVRSYRTTLPRFGYSEPVDTASLPPQRRVSATFKDLPGGQQLGATFDYTHRLFTDRDTDGPEAAALTEDVHMPRVTDLLAGATSSRTPIRTRTTPNPWTSPAIRPRSRCPGPAVCRPSHAATKGSCCRWAIPLSAGTAGRTHSPARSASARSRSNSSRPNWVSRFRWVVSRSPNAR